MRLIDAEELIENLLYDVELDEKILDDIDFVGNNRELIQFDKDCKLNAIEFLRDAPTIEIRSNCLEIPNSWIPCTPETMPEDGERVLCTHLGGLNPNRQVIEHIYQNGKFVLGWDMDMNPSSPTFGQRYMGKVVAWMPLPEPYGGEQE